MGEGFCGSTFSIACEIVGRILQPWGLQTRDMHRGDMPAGLDNLDTLLSDFLGDVSPKRWHDGKLDAVSDGGVPLMSICNSQKIPRSAPKRRRAVVTLLVDLSL
jgi:hypothetical protein